MPHIDDDRFEGGAFPLPNWWIDYARDNAITKHALVLYILLCSVSDDRWVWRGKPETLFAMLFTRPYDLSRCPRGWRQLVEQGLVTEVDEDVWLVYGKEEPPGDAIITPIGARRDQEAR